MTTIATGRTFYISATVVAAIAAIAGEWFHMITAIAEVFFFSAIAAITAMVAIIWKPGFNLIMANVRITYSETSI